MSEENSRIGHFVAQYWADHALGQERTLDEYAELFPGDLERLASEYLSLRARHRTEASDDETSIGPYRTTRELGRGGQGVVYLATDTRFGRTVALKVLRNVGALGEEVLARFRREALVASRLNHPHICGVLDAEIEGGVPYIAMPFLEGRTLADQINDSLANQGGDEESSFVQLDFSGDEEASAPSTPASTSDSTSIDRKQINEILRLFEAAARALHVAHEAGVVHRDLKPANIMVQEDGSPVLLDFGLATSDDIDLETLTQSGDMFGTPAYMSPEQLTRGVLRIDRRTDVYSLAVSLFESVTLRKPFTAPTREALFNAVLTDETPHARRLNPRLPRDLAAVLSKAMEKNRERRYATAEDLAEELRRVRFGEPIKARAASPLRRLVNTTRRHPVLSVATLALFALLGTVATFSTMRARESARALEESRRFTDLGRLEAAEQAARELIPPSTDTLPAIAQWVERHTDLESRKATYEQQLAELRSEGAPSAAGAGTATTRELRERLETLALEKGSGEGDDEEKRRAPIEAELERTRGALERLSSWTYTGEDATEKSLLDSGLVRLIARLDEFTRPSGTLRRTEERLQQARRIREETVTRHAEAWRDVSRRLNTDPRFELGIQPIEGLIPIGRDPNSGLEEFLHWLSHEGGLPKRDSKGTLQRTHACGIVLVLVPGGRARLGSTASDPEDPNHDRFAPNRPFEAGIQEHQLAPFLISKFETTQAQWARGGNGDPSFLSHQTYDEERWRRNGHPLLSGSSPVESISWNEATEAGRAWGLQLPTEAQWEWACRARASEPRDAEWFHGRENLNHLAPWKPGGAEDIYPVHAPVGSMLPNEFGLHDMLGNVMEWCRERRDLYRTGPLVGPDGWRVPVDASEPLRAIRGGDFNAIPGFRAEQGATARPAHRTWQPEDRYRERTLGVRYVLRLDD